MDSFELNKIAGAVLGTLLFVVALGIIAGGIYHTGHPEQPGMEIAGVGHGGEAPAAPTVEAIAVRLAAANPERGKALAGQCAGCHTLESGQPHGIGPNLWGVVGGPLAHAADFEYSDALRQHAADGETWSFEHLDEFIAKPQAVIPGTKMGFPGIANPQGRADVIAYLNNQSDSPLPLPAPEETAAADGTAPAEGTEAHGETAAPAEAAAAAPAEAPAAAPAEQPAPVPAPEPAPAE